MPDRLRRNAANLVTALRVVLTPVFIAAVCVADGRWPMGLLAGALFVVIAASDVWDGRLARRWESASSSGRTFDHFADIGFILSALSTYVVLSLAPWWVPAAIGASFAFYVFDSWARSTPGSPSLIGSRIGHTVGICNYVLIGILVFNDTAGIHLLSPGTVHALFWLVPFYSAAAVLSRLAARRPVLSTPEPA